MGAYAHDARRSRGLDACELAKAATSESDPTSRWLKRPRNRGGKLSECASRRVTSFVVIVLSGRNLLCGGGTRMSTASGGEHKGGRMLFATLFPPRTASFSAGDRFILVSSSDARPKTTERGISTANEQQFVMSPFFDRVPGRAGNPGRVGYRRQVASHEH